MSTSAGAFVPIGGLFSEDEDEPIVRGESGKPFGACSALVLCSNVIIYFLFFFLHRFLSKFFFSSFFLKKPILFWCVSLSPSNFATAAVCTDSTLTKNSEDNAASRLNRYTDNPYLSIPLLHLPHLLPPPFQKNNAIFFFCAHFRLLME